MVVGGWVVVRGRVWYFVEALDALRCLGINGGVVEVSWRDIRWIERTRAICDVEVAGENEENGDGGVWGGDGLLGWMYV